MYGGQRARPAGILASSRTKQDVALRLPLSLSRSLSILLFLFSLLSSTQKITGAAVRLLTFIFLLFSFFYFFSLFQHLLFSFSFFLAPPFFFFFLILFLLISSSCPAPDLHRPTLPPQAVLEILRCVSWWPQSSIALSPDNIDGLDFLC